MAGFAMQHAEVVAENISAQLRDEPPTGAYRPLGHPMILLPLGSGGGVGRLPSPDGPFAPMVAEFNGADPFAGRFLGQFGPTRHERRPWSADQGLRGRRGVSRSGARPRSRSRR
ncbi:hypothetical protein ACFYST_25750 [Kitasatospora sp. NPDC004614]|uniref:hypothetical protein n=1 Tax=unclassified Kitasatospora TaxID=2633591 RepID=UPI003686BE43